MSYPTLALLAQASQTPVRVEHPPKHLDGLTLVEPAAQTPLHYLRDGCVVLYKRPRSNVWHQIRLLLRDYIEVLNDTSHRFNGGWQISLWLKRSSSFSK